MRTAAVLLALCLALVAGVPTNDQRIIGGSETTIEEYPFAACLLRSWNGINFFQSCGGAIINNRAILTAAHCTHGTSAHMWRIRVGSAFASSGGSVHIPSRFINHESYDTRTQDNDVGVIHSTTAFIFSNSIRPGSIAGSSYNLADNQVVWAIGWGHTSFNGSPSEQLRHVQVWTVNQNVCMARYAEVMHSLSAITENMLCSGWLDVGGRDQCQQDSGSPLLHNNVIVGVCSWGHGCAQPRYPGVNARVTRYTTWIQANA